MSIISIDNEQMIFSSDELREQGLSYYKINQLVEMNVLKKLSKSYYENLHFQGDVSDFYYVAAYVPNGVICLLSAAVYYNLSRFIPDSIDIAIKRKGRVSTIPDWPSLNIHFFTDDRYSLGLTTINDGKNCFKIYDIEKTVIDIVFYRENIGLEETKEVIINYLKRSDRNLNKLMTYAELMKCRDILSNYLEVLL